MLVGTFMGVMDRQEGAETVIAQAKVTGAYTKGRTAGTECGNTTN